MEIRIDSNLLKEILIFSLINSENQKFSKKTLSVK